VKGIPGAKDEVTLPMILHLSDLEPAVTQYYLQHLIAPRPIALASTIDEEGNVNLSPFSFFNLFSTNPPIVIFSPARRLRNNTTKHTLDNIRVVPEVAISIVTYEMVHQVSLASCEYPKGTDEYIKAGFTKKTSALIAPPMVAEAKASLECRVNEIKSLGEKGGSGQLVIAEVLCMHIDDELITSENKINQEKIGHVARLGADWYARITPTNLFRVPKPNTQTGVGFDALPESIRNSEVLTGNHLAQLANVTEVPLKQKEFSDERLKAIVQYFKPENNLLKRIHSYAKELIEDGHISEAWQVLLYECDKPQKLSAQRFRNS
jgi:flavin reductase (DIM6/NTAB) family NADH-FMN oxidoreductase RutF